MANHMFTAEEIVRVYELRKQGKTYTEIEREIGNGIKSNSFFYVLGRLQQSLDNKVNDSDSEYRRAVKIISGEQQTEQSSQKEEVTEKQGSGEADLIDKINAITETFLIALAKLIVEDQKELLEEARASENKVKELVKEVEELRALQTEAKKSNYLSFLKKNYIPSIKAVVK